MPEEWRDIAGFEGRYEVSDHGRVKSLSYRGHGAPKPMLTTPNWSGYQVVTLGAERAQFRVHCLVLEAFVGPRPVGMQGCHCDGDKSNNHLYNLRWDTPSGNASDRRSYAAGENPNARLTTDQMVVVKERRLAGEKTTSLAREFGVTATRVSQIARMDFNTGKK